MSLLLEDHQVATNEVLLRLQEAADHYQAVAATTDSEALKTVCEQGLSTCNDSIRKLLDHIAKQGHLPREADTERETIEHSLSRISAALAADESSAYRVALQQREKAIGDAVTATEKTTLPDGGRQLMQDIDAASNARISSLKH